VEKPMWSDAEFFRLRRSISEECAQWTDVCSGGPWRDRRESKGDLVIPAQMATPEAINFMAMHGARANLSVRLSRRAR